MSATARLLMIAFAITALAVSARAGDRGGGPDPSIASNGRIEVHKRYPGDVDFGPGYARVKGPDKGVYIERCYWTSSSQFFGLPLGFTQHCVRHTLENTR